jgi:hypothetical protein
MAPAPEEAPKSAPSRWDLAATPVGNQGLATPILLSLFFGSHRNGRACLSIFFVVFHHLQGSLVLRDTCSRRSTQICPIEMGPSCHPRWQSRTRHSHPSIFFSVATATVEPASAFSLSCSTIFKVAWSSVTSSPRFDMAPAPEEAPKSAPSRWDLAATPVGNQGLATPTL